MEKKSSDPSQSSKGDFDKEIERLIGDDALDEFCMDDDAKHSAEHLAELYRGALQQGLNKMVTAADTVRIKLLRVNSLLMEVKSSLASAQEFRNKFMICTRQIKENRVKATGLNKKTKALEILSKLAEEKKALHKRITDEMRNDAFQMRGLGAPELLMLAKKHHELRQALLVCIREQIMVISRNRAILKKEIGELQGKK